MTEPQVLRPYNAQEAITTADACRIAGKALRTIVEWCQRYCIGRKVKGRWAVSRVALAMLLDGDEEDLRLYLSGDRQSDSVVNYFHRLNVSLPRRSVIGTKPALNVEAVR